jgi:mono/diheme cytochrome c family protein
MGASGAFNLQTSEITMDERVEVITNGRNVMTPFKAILSPDEIQAVAEYSLELKID